MTAIERDILVPCVRMVYDVSWNHKSRVSSAVFARSNNRNNIKKLTAKRENISVGFEPRTFRSKINQTASLSYPLDYHESYDRAISANTLTRKTFCTD